MSIPQKLFVNVYASFCGQIGTAYATKELADQMAAYSRLACIEVDLTSHTTFVVEDRAAK